MDWRSVDERLVRRGEVLLSIEFLERYDEELKAMNRGKEAPLHLNLFSRRVFGCCTLPFWIALQAAGRLHPCFEPSASKASFSGLFRA